MAKEKKFITCDGNAAAAHIAYMFSEVSCIYPITPSSPMAENVDEWAAKGRKNMFGETVRVIEMQSEGGAAGAVHGSLQAGALTTTYTASQGLLLMIPNMYKIAGELLPCVFHVSARALAAHALNIFGDHADVYAARQTGFAMLASGSVQEVMDLSAVSHLTAIKSRVPFVNFFDGFRTSHEIQKIEELQMEDIKGLVDMDALQAFRDRALNSENPVTRGTAQNPDIYFQGREASNKFYDAVPDMVADYMDKISAITGRKYRPFDYYGAADAENIIIAMGSVTETIREVIDYENANGQKVGMIAVHLYRPFSAKYFMEAVPATVKRITVLDRTKEPGANGDPLYLDVRDIFYGQANAPVIVGGRYGMGSKDVTPSQIIAVYKNMERNEPKNQFTIGIEDDVTFRSLPAEADVKMTPAGTYEAKFYGLGSDGTVGANKNSIKIIGGATNKYCQAYFAYDSKKSGGFTASHLRFGDCPIRSTYLITTPDFVACHVPAYIHMYDVLKGLQKGGSFLLNSIWDEEETKKHLPNHMKRYLAENEINFYIINGTKTGQELGLGNRTNTIMQSAFFKITNVIPYEVAVSEMKHAIDKSYGKKGEAIVNMNYAAVDAGGNAVVKVEVPAEWANIVVKEEEHTADAARPDFVKKIVDPINALKGDLLPVSAFNGREDGTWDNGTAAYEKRGIAVNVPEWKIGNCIQCNQCAYVCPHATIRPFAMTEDEAAAAPEATRTLDAMGPKAKGMKFTMAVSPLDCMGCTNCVKVCPKGALEMVPTEQEMDQQPVWDYMVENVSEKKELIAANVKGSQFKQPYLEFSGSCAGCAETSYARLVTQLFGDRMYISNATGCSSIWGGPGATSPYCTDKNGHGPAWCNSLFEDNAEHGFGMYVGQEKIREDLMAKTEQLLAIEWAQPALKEAAQKWLDTKDDGNANAEATKEYVAALQANIATVDELAAVPKFAEHAAELKAKGEKFCDCDACKLVAAILKDKEYLEKKSIWIFGGDGWAYDIGFGGVDHVLASGKDVNVFVFDTEVYSNTGGQASKSSNIGQVAQFAAAGKETKKKSLSEIAMSYGYIYVAQVAMGANPAQTIKAITEAEAYNGPSLIIGYSPCEMHSIKGGMINCQKEMKKAVECGYWNLFRFNPAADKKFTLDSKAPAGGYREFLMNEARYSRLTREFPERAEGLFTRNEDAAKERYEHLTKLIDLYDKQ